MKDRIVFLVVTAALSAWTVQSAKQVVEGSNSYNENNAANTARTRSLLLSQLAEEGEQRDLIVGGKEANPGDFPYYVHLLKCGGSLISPSVVLTAAHCGNFNGSKAFVGCHDYGQATGNAVERKVVNQILHPDYNSEVFSFDYNLLLLDEPVLLANHTNIVLTLNEDDLVPAEGQEVTVLGLGLLEEKGDSPDKVRFVEVKKTADEYCNEAYEGDIEDSVQFCAGVDGGGKDACQGDSGGPLVIPQGDEHIQVGVVSSGTGCASPKYPGIYARVSGQMDWIRKIVCDEWNQTDATFCPAYQEEATRTGRAIAKPRAQATEWFRIQSKDGDGTTPYCLSLQDGYMATNGKAIVMLPCDGTYQQQWTQFDNDYLIRSKMNPNKCVSLKENNKLELYDCFEDNHATAFQAYSDGTIRFMDDSTKCWEFITSNSTMEVTDCEGSLSQKWKTTVRQDDMWRTKHAVQKVLETKHAGEEEEYYDSWEAKHAGEEDNHNGWETKHAGEEEYYDSWEAKHAGEEEDHNGWEAKHAGEEEYHNDWETKHAGEEEYQSGREYWESAAADTRYDDSSFTYPHQETKHAEQHKDTIRAGTITTVPHEPRDDNDHGATWFRLRNLKTGTCLALKATTDLTLLVLEACIMDDTSINSGQRWGLTNSGELESKLDPTKCVVPSGDGTLGSAMLVYSCSEDNLYGEWEIPGFDEEENPVGPIFSKEDSTKCLASHALDSVVTLGHCPHDEDHVRNDRLWEVL